MAFSRMHIRGCCVVVLILNFLIVINAAAVTEEDTQKTKLDSNLGHYVNTILSKDNYTIIPGVFVGKKFNISTQHNESDNKRSKTANQEDSSVYKKLDNYVNSRVVSIYFPEAARSSTPAETGKSSFMAGFGMGFLAFALKKLLLPLVFGAQVIKSLLIILFLPSLVGSLGKLLGKGLSTVSGISGASGLGQHNNNQVIEDFEFKDTDPYANDATNLQGVNSLDNSYGASSDTSSSTISTPTAANRLGINQRVAYVPYRSEDYYLRMPPKKTDFKVFHKIPSSTLLLATYDPFYSPLLSRLDTVFQQLGLGSGKSPETEKCRERLVCMMYANPAKFAPYSNLVSAQLSRELNELRKPSSDNPEILRFFRYMKAARDGQDGEECLAHVGCPALMGSDTKPALITTYNEINKLVQARKL